MAQNFSPNWDGNTSLPLFTGFAANATDVAWVLPIVSDVGSNTPSLLGWPPNEIREREHIYDMTYRMLSTEWDDDPNIDEILPTR